MKCFNDFSYNPTAKEIDITVRSQPHINQLKGEYTRGEALPFPSLHILPMLRNFSKDLRTCSSHEICWNPLGLSQYRDNPVNETDFREACHILIELEWHSWTVQVIGLHSVSMGNHSFDDP